jgi:hypothetical protein
MVCLLSAVLQKYGRIFVPSSTPWEKRLHRSARCRKGSCRHARRQRRAPPAPSPRKDRSPAAHRGRGGLHPLHGLCCRGLRRLRWVVFRELERTVARHRPVGAVSSSCRRQLGAPWRQLPPMAKNRQISLASSGSYSDSESDSKSSDCSNCSPMDGTSPHAPPASSLLTFSAGLPDYDTRYPEH